MNRLFLLFTLAFIPTAIAKSTEVNLIFSPENEKYLTAVQEYQRIWSEEGEKMIAAMEQVSGLKFVEKEVQVIVFEGPSQSGGPSSPMKMRASYPRDVKQATLIHELGHRMNFQLRNRPNDMDEHRILFLYLYDVWEKLYGKQYADKQVEIESKRKGIYDYETAWKWALSLSKEERTTKLKEIVQSNKK
ncbi:MAG: hypothetical protein L0220_07080 [Acidobacteria bacterium]|nr:hypothetical protein [Acidobacteriota bacterium]